HVLGPNTPLNSFQPCREDLPGKRIALITQSGHQGRPIYQAQQNGIALAGWAPTGNESDLESADFIAHYARQPNIGAIACYLEGFKDGRTLMLAADEAARNKVPIVMIKVGRSDIGRSWAQAKLREWIPGFLRVSNPVDSGGIATGDERGPKILEAILNDPNVGVLIAPIAGSFSPISDKLARDLVDAASKTSKPVCVIWGSP